MDFGGYCDPEAAVCIFKRFPGPGALFTTSIKICIFRKILNRKFPRRFFRFCPEIMKKFNRKPIFGCSRDSYRKAVQIHKKAPKRQKFPVIYSKKFRIYFFCHNEPKSPKKQHFSVRHPHHKGPPFCTSR